MSVVFSIDKTNVRNSFSSAAKTYDSLATLQRKVGLELLTDISVISANSSIVDVGCGTGFLTRELLKDVSLRNIIAVDIALPMLEYTKANLAQYENINYICADAELLPLQANSVENVISNLALQWCPNLTAVFAGFKQILRSNGQLCFSTFGPTTLQELKQAWSKVDSYSHVNYFYSAEQILFYLKQAGFVDIHLQTKQYQSKYRTVMALMRELKGIGAHNVLSGRNRKTTRKSDLYKMISNYEKIKANEFIPATYEVIFVSARKG